MWSRFINTVTLYLCIFSNTVRQSIFWQQQLLQSLYSREIPTVILTAGNCQQVQGREWQHNRRTGHYTHILGAIMSFFCAPNGLYRLNMRKSACIADMYYICFVFVFSRHTLCRVCVFLNFWKEGHYSCKAQGSAVSEFFSGCLYMAAPCLLRCFLGHPDILLLFTIYCCRNSVQIQKRLRQTVAHVKPTMLHYRLQQIVPFQR